MILSYNRAMNKTLLAAVAVSALCAAACPAPAQAAAPARTVHFSGYDWEVRPGADGGPGPNHWAPENVRVDARGRLHLKITRQGSVWRCAEVTLRRSLGYGRYEFQTTGTLDTLDPNVVLGLFNYPLPGGGPDGTQEIDIEYSRWGRPASLPASETIYPAHLGPKSTTHEFAVPPGLTQSTHRFEWQPAALYFQCYAGHGSPAQPPYENWTFRPADRKRLPSPPLPVHLNLWLVDGHPPINGQEVEIVVDKFSFAPIVHGR